jgi:hypothetical protein
MDHTTIWDSLGVLAGPTTVMVAAGAVWLMARVIWRDYQDQRRERA